MAHRDLLAEDEARSLRVAGMRALAAEKRSSTSRLDYPQDWLYGALGASPTASGARVGEQSALSVETVFACVSILSDMIGLVPCKLYRKTASNSREVATDHPASRLVTGSPDGNSTQFEWRRFTQTGVGLGGNGYGRVYRDSFYQPGEIEPIAPCDMRVERVKVNGRRRVLYFVEGERNPLTRADFVHIPGLSTNGYTGLSPIRAARESIGLALTMRESAGREFKNGSKPSFGVTRDGNMSPEDLKKASDFFAANFGGAENAGKVPFFANGWKTMQLQGMTLADAEFLESRKYTDSQIAKMYRVPEVLIGATDKTSSWGSGIETLTQGFLSFCLNPWLCNWEQALAITLLSADEIAAGYYFKFNREALLQASLQAQAAWIDCMRKNTIQPVNEIREKLELDDVPDAIGDRIDLPLNNQGGVAASNQPATAGKEDES